MTKIQISDLSDLFFFKLTVKVVKVKCLFTLMGWWGEARLVVKVGVAVVVLGMIIAISVDLAIKVLALSKHFFRDLDLTSGISDNLR